MDLETRIELIKRPPTEEIITEQDLTQLLETKQKTTAYDGLDPTANSNLCFAYSIIRLRQDPPCLNSM